MPAMITEALNAPRLCVSMVLHNSSLEQLRVTLDSLIVSLRGLDGLVAGPVCLSLLDNCSHHDYRRELATLTADLERECDARLSVRLQFSEQNTGFGSGHNQALKDTPGASGYVLILNPDVELAPDALREALCYLEQQPDVVAVNPYCERSDGSREYLCKRYPAAVDLVLRGLPFPGLRQLFAPRLARYEYRDLAPAVPANVCLLSGACLLCRHADFVATGGFNEQFFMYFEDFDLSLRLASRGSLMYLPSMRIVHHGGFAATKGLRHIGWFVRSALRFFSLHGWRLH
ncbi:MAG: glycosyltransferase [Congregibacter sp.]|nr:glycosyltransferase [Congregibacter sp.]